MKKVKFLKASILSMLAFSVLVSCEKENIGGGEEDPNRTFFNISAKFDDNDSEVYIAPVESLDEGSLSFQGNGMKLPSVRSARVMANKDNVYNFDYGGGLLYQYINNADGKTYNQLKEIDISLTMGGVTYVRPKMISDQTILFHNIVRSVITGTELEESHMYVTRVQIPETSIAEIMEPYLIPETTWDINDDAYVYRVDVPTVMDDKIYYGVGRKLNDEDNGTLTGMHTIVLDYPSLENPKYIRSELANGNTNGYRGPNAHAINGYVYQVNRADVESDATVLLRLKDGAYDEDYVFNITEALGEGAVYTSNWYHVGNGIAYMPYAKFAPADENNAWGVARIDINNKTAVKLNVPMSDLFQYQSGVVDNGKFYMAISPIGGDAYVYGFDIDSDSPDAFKKGLELDKGNIFIQGIY